MAAPNGAGAESQPIMSLRELPTPPAMGLPLSAFLDALTDPAVRSIMSALASATAEVAALAREGGTEAAGGSNTFGDEQLAIDLAAEAAILRILRTVPAVATVASEENPADQTVHADGTHSVAFDPLDGSSVVASNWAVGSIVRPPPPLNLRRSVSVH